MSASDASDSTFMGALSTLRAHRTALEVLLPSVGATQLQRSLGPRLRDLAHVMNSPSITPSSTHPKGSHFQRQLWLRAKSSGLTALLLDAAALTAALDDEASCLSLICIGNKETELPSFLFDSFYEMRGQPQMISLHAST